MWGEWFVSLGQAKMTGQPPNTVNGVLDAAMDTMQVALLQSLPALLSV